MNNRANPLYDYDDICLVPAMSTCKSRSDLSTSVRLGSHTFTTPVVPANMLCTISVDLAVQLAAADVFYVMHRFDDYYTLFNFASNARAKYTSLSIGVKKADYDFVTRLSDRSVKVDYITIDVAHGHSILVRDMIKHVKDKLPETFVIAGNAGTVEGAEFLQFHGADAVKVGLGMGRACITYDCTGVGTPMFSVVNEIVNRIQVPVIACGGAKSPGDVCKALVAGATLVMQGAEFASCAESPAYYDSMSATKTYFGSASRETKIRSKNNVAFIEGAVIQLPLKNETYRGYIHRVNQGIQSCMSYAGVSFVSELINMKWRPRYHVGH
jgi:GMP reductase